MSWWTTLSWFKSVQWLLADSSMMSHPETSSRPWKFMKAVPCRCKEEYKSYFSVHLCGSAVICKIFPSDCHLGLEVHYFS